jgi:histone chaperone ASF1
LEWKVIYVGCAEDSLQDQVLEEVMVGPVPVGHNKFVLQAPAPDPAHVTATDLIGVTVVLVTCSFLDHEFVRIGYYVNNEYTEPYEEGTLPNPLDITKVRRNILAAEPRVTRFAIDWTGQGTMAPVDDGEVVEVDDDDAGMNLDDMDELEDGSDLSGDDGEEGSDIELDDGDDMDEMEAEGEGDMNEAASSVGMASPEVMLQDDSNSMDVGMMQGQSALY